MNFKTILVVLVIGIFSLQMNAQKCKYDFDEKDPMTEERVRRNSYKLKAYLRLGLYRRGDDYRVEINFNYSGERNDIVEKGNELLLKLSDGTLLKLPSTEDVTPITNLVGNYIVTTYAVSYKINEEEMRKIAKSGIAVTRVNLAGQEVTVESSKRETRITGEGATCILTD